MIVTHPTTVLHSSLSSLLTTSSYNQPYNYVYAIIAYHNRFINGSRSVAYAPIHCSLAWPLLSARALLGRGINATGAYTGRPSRDTNQ